jgi:5-methylcytosine-specific restriction endonuclease McrA
MATRRAGLRRIVELRAGQRCEYCRAPQWIFNSPFHIEHIIARARDGSDDLNNLALSCGACNFAKSSAIEGIDPETGLLVPLFNPRTQLWADHFTVSPDGSAILGTTAIGRASVLVLNMNVARQTEARVLWVRLGIFP